MTAVPSPKLGLCRRSSTGTCPSQPNGTSGPAYGATVNLNQGQVTLKPTPLRLPALNPQLSVTFH